MLYFNSVKSADELKSLFRKLCNELHPDKGGKSSDFINMMNEYNSIKDSFNKDFEAENLNADKFYNLIQQLDILQGCEIEFIGTFIWIGGDTKTNKDLIKNLILDGYNTARWAKNKQLWYFSPMEYKKKSGKAFTMDQIRSSHGVQFKHSTNGLKKLS